MPIVIFTVIAILINVAAVVINLINGGPVWVAINTVCVIVLLIVLSDTVSDYRLHRHK